MENTVATPSSALTVIKYEPALEAEIEKIATAAAQRPYLAGRYPPRWLAIQLLEGDETILADAPPDDQAAMETAVAESMARLRSSYGDDVDLALTGQRYDFVHDLAAQVLDRPDAYRRSRSDRIDQILTHKWLGIPIFLALMYLVFNLVQNVSAPYLDWIDAVFSGPLTAWAAALLGAVSAPSWIISLVTDGVIAGVGGVLVFLPGLLVMYLSLALMEDTGYLARAAFVMDRAMSKLGLHGRSFVPMILGFGCNVPAIYATRTIENRSARLLTGMLIPFMSCSARLPVYVIFGLAFFPRNGDIVIWGLYLTGIIVAAAVGIILSRTVFRGHDTGILVMEMPPYRPPSLRRVLSYTWEQSAAFVRKAGTFILVGTVVFWVLLNLPWGVSEPADSYFGQVSDAVAPTLEPAGFGEWQATGALLTGLLAKEMVVSTLSQVYVGEAGGGETAVSPDIDLLADLQTIVAEFGAAALEAGRQLLETLTPGVTLFADGGGAKDTALTAALRGAFTPLSAVAFLVFVLLYVPCLATLGAQIQEFGWQWALFSAAITLVVPWTLAALVYQSGRLLGLGA